jgi:protein NrfD
MTVRRVVYALAVIALLIGLYGFYSRLFFGERDVNYGSYVNWGLWVAMYLFFAGMAAGSYMISSLDYLFRIKMFRGTGKYALWISLSTLPFALMLIGFDLGRMERVWKVILAPNLGSVMAQLVWSYSIFFGVVLVSFYLAMKHPDSRIFRIVMAGGLVLSVFVSGGVGALLGVNVARETLHAAMLPAQFPILNFASGVALMLVAVGLFGIVRDPDQRATLIRTLSLILVALLIVKAYFLWVDYSQALYGGAPHAVDAAEEVLFGTFGWAFWIFQVLLGLIVPAVILLNQRWSGHGMVAGLAAMFVLFGLAVGRTAIIFPAFTFQQLEGLTDAFTGPHLNIDYVPSLMEWSVLLGVLGLSTLVFVIGIDWLPFLKRNQEVTQ